MSIQQPQQFSMAGEFCYYDNYEICQPLEQSPMFSAFEMTDMYPIELHNADVIELAQHQDRVCYAEKQEYNNEVIVEQHKRCVPQHQHLTVTQVHKSSPSSHDAAIPVPVNEMPLVPTNSAVVIDDNLTQHIIKMSKVHPLKTKNQPAKKRKLTVLTVKNIEDNLGEKQKSGDQQQQVQQQQNDQVEKFIPLVETSYESDASTSQNLACGKLPAIKMTGRERQIKLEQLEKDLINEQLRLKEQIALLERQTASMKKVLEGLVSSSPDYHEQVNCVISTDIFRGHNATVH